jgi:hypothetical protein
MGRSDDFDIDLNARVVETLAATAVEILSGNTDGIV